MIGLCTATTQLDTSVNIAFPTITRAIADIQWFVISYMLTYASLLVALGRIGDTVGHIRVFRIGLVWSAVALPRVGWSPGFGAMLLFRVLQGIDAALVAGLVTMLFALNRLSESSAIWFALLSGAAFAAFIAANEARHVRSLPSTFSRTRDSCFLIWSTCCSISRLSRSGCWCPRS